MKLDITKEELKIIMDCMIITDKHINDEVVMVPNEEKERLEKFNLNGLWVKLYEKYEEEN